MADPDLTAADARGDSSAPLVLRMLLIASCVCALVPLAYSVHYGRVWWNERRGETLVEQRLQYVNTPWFQPYFQAFCHWFNEQVPADAGVLLTPKDPETESGRGRWFLFLNYFAYPRRIYVRKPHLASGTMVDYPRWLRHHFRDLPRERDSEVGLGAMIAREREEAQRWSELGIEWELVYPVSRVFLPERLQLRRLVDGDWQEVAIPGRIELLDLAGIERGPQPNRESTPDGGGG